MCLFIMKELGEKLKSAENQNYGRVAGTIIMYNYN